MVDTDQSITKDMTPEVRTSTIEHQTHERLRVTSNIKTHSPSSMHPETRIKLVTLLKVILTFTSIVAWSQSASGQTSCLTNIDVQRMLAEASTSRFVSFNKELKDILLEMKENGQKRFQETIEESLGNDALTARTRAFRKENTAGLCSILKQYGWPSVALVGQDGEAAAFYLLKNSSSFELQRELLPLMVSITRKGEIDRADLAGFVDRLRLSIGLNQLFGTEATIRDGFLVLYPIEDEAHVDERRKEYNLQPMDEYIRFLERIYLMPLVKSPARTTPKRVFKSPITNSDGPDLLAHELKEETGVVRVETNLVSLDVSVYSQNLQSQVTPLEQTDFKIFEDGHDETITFFAATRVSFDLVLLIDLSGSTLSERDLIRKTTRHFIEAVTPSDRVAIVTFSDTAKIIAPLTEDRTKLLESVKNIEGTGGTKAWDALKFTLDKVVGSRTLTRRQAVVFITDGVDNNLLGFGEQGSKISFADLLENVRRDNTLIIPIYLDTEGHDPTSHSVYDNARKTLSMLAEESGGVNYKARKIEDLDSVYRQVIEDLGQIYSVGYRPTNAKRDGSWRTIKIQILNRPDLATRVRRGYYAN